MSLRKLAHSLGKNKEGRRGTSGSSAASWSPSNSRSHTPLQSSVSLPDSIVDSSLQRYPSPTHSQHSSTSSQPIYNPTQTPLRIVAPFVYNAPPQAYESSSTLSSTESRESEAATVRIKRSLTKILSPASSGSGDEASSHQYHYQKQSGSSSSRGSSRKGSMSDSESGKKSRKPSFFSSSYDEQGNPPTSNTKKLVSWIGQKQNGVTKKVQQALRSGGPSSLQPGQSKSMARVSNEFHDEEDDSSSISSAPSFVQNAPEDEVSRILSEPDNIPPLPMGNMQTPYQIPAAVYLPRSHTNLHALTLASLAFPPSPHPLLYNPNLPAFPRSSNPSSKLPRLPTFRAHVAKTRILDRLEAQDLTQAENESIIPFGRQEEFTPRQQPPQVPTEGESDESRKINDQPGRSVGLEAWTRRPSFKERLRVWLPPNRGDGVIYERVTLSRPLNTELKISGGIRALAGLVVSRPASPSRDLIEQPPAPVTELPPLPPLPLLPLLPPSSSPSPGGVDTQVIENAAPSNGIEPLPIFTPTSATLVAPPVNPPLPSPRPLPRPPGPVDPSAVTAQQQLLQWQQDDNDSAPVVSIRPLPPRPLPVPPSPQIAAPPTPPPAPAPAVVSSPQVTVDELESIDGPVLVATAVLDVPQRSSLLSPPGSINGHGSHPQSVVHSSSTITSAPLTPLDPMETESLRRRSISSMSIVLPAPGSFSLEEMDGLEMTNPNEIDPRRRSVVSLKASVHKRLSMASRASRGSSPSLRNHPLPTLSESSRYSESSHQSSQHTHAGSAATSNEKLNRRTDHSMSSISFEPPSEPMEQVPSEHDSPVVAESVMESIRPEDHPPLEPSRISEEHIDPFITSQAAKSPQQKLEFSVNGSSPILSPADSQRLLSSDPRPLSLSTDMSTPIAQKPTPKSPLTRSGGPSPTPSGQSPTGSESAYSVDYDASRASFSSSSGPVKFVKLKRSGSQMTGEKSPATGSGATGGKSRTLKNPPKFWPHNRRVDEKEEEDSQDGVSEMSAKQNHTSWGAQPQSRTSFSGPESEALVSPEETPTPNAAALNKPTFITEDIEESIANLPPDVAFDVARLSDTSKLDLTLFNPQRTPPSINKDLPRNSLSSARSRSDSDSASRAASVKEIAANMTLLPGQGALRAGGRGHVRTPSSERAARIEAHLDSVGSSSSRYRPLYVSNQRPDFLPPPSRNRIDYSNSFGRQSGEDIDRTPMQGSFDRVSQSEDSIEEESIQDLPNSPRPQATFTPPVSRPPARWSEAGWRERQRSLNTLPLPSASISHSATRPNLYASSMSRPGPVSSTPSIFKPASSQPGTLYGRPLRP